MNKKRMCLIMVLGVSLLAGCGRNQPVPISYDKIETMDLVSISIPSDYRKDKESYPEYYKDLSSIENHFASGVIEEVSPDGYMLTDRDTFYFSVQHGTAAKSSCYYMDSTHEIETSIKPLGVFRNLSMSSKPLLYQDEKMVRLSAYAEFTIPFGSDAVTKPLMGYISILEYHGEQYYCICGMSEEIYNDEILVDMVSTFAVSGEKSSLYASEDLEYYGEESNQVSFPTSKDLFVQMESGWEIPSYGVSLSFLMQNSGADHELSLSEQKGVLDRTAEVEAGYQYNPVLNTKCAGTDGTIWNIITYEVKLNGDLSYETDCFSGRGRSICILRAAYEENPEQVSNLMKNLLSQSAFTGYMQLDGTVVSGKTTEEETTEITTENTTEAATEITTEITTEATTEASTEATTEITTEITTENTTEATTAATTEATTEKKTEQKTTQKSTQSTNKNKNSSKKKNTGSNDLNVEW